MQLTEKRYERRDDKEKIMLVIHKAKIDDTGMYSCEIQQYVKEGESDQTNAWVTVEGKYRNSHVSRFFSAYSVSPALFFKK